MCVSCFPTSPCEVFNFSSASHCLRLPSPPPPPPPSLPPPQPHLTQLISHNSSPTTSLSHNLISHNTTSLSHNLISHNSSHTTHLTQSHLPQKPHTTHLPQLHLTQPHLTSSHTTTTHSTSTSCHLTHPPLTQLAWQASAAFGASGATFAWQAKHLVLLDLLLRGKCSTYRLSGNGWRVLGRRWAPAAFVWLSHHLVLLELLLPGTRNIFLRLDFVVRGRCSSGKCWSALGRRWAPAAFAWRAYFCVAGATVLRCGNC